MNTFMHDGERVVEISQKTANITTWFYFKSLMYSDNHFSGAEMIEFINLKANKNDSPSSQIMQIVPIVILLERNKDTLQ